MEDLLEGLLELAIQEATIKARDVVRLRGGDKAPYVAKAREAAEKTKELGSLLKTYEKDSLIPQTKTCEGALGKLIKNSTDPSTPPDAVNEALREYLISLKTLNTMFKEMSGAPPMPPPPPPGGGKLPPPASSVPPAPAGTSKSPLVAPAVTPKAAPVATPAPAVARTGSGSQVALSSSPTVARGSGATTSPAAAGPVAAAAASAAARSSAETPKVRANTASAPRVDESKITATYSNLFGEESPNSFAAKVADTPAAAAAGKADLPDFEQLLNGESQSDARFEVQEYDLQPKKMVHASVSQKDSFDANKSLIKNLWGAPRKK